MFSFRLSEDFVAQFEHRPVDWGYKDAAGNSLGEITYLRTYSRLKDDGKKERWFETCRRVIEGTFSIQKDHCKTNRLPWNDHKAQRTAQDAYERMFCFKWTPPGRGLWIMGTPLVMEQRNSAALQNCAFISTADMTKYDPAWPFAFLMEASMLGIGVGFDTKGAEKGFTLYQPIEDEDKSWTYVVPDTREGWVQAMVHKLESYLTPGKGYVHYDSTLVRPAGELIHTFGGTAAGPEPLLRLLLKLDELLQNRHGQLLTTADIADIGNLIGVCVVSGNVRRSAELLIGDIRDQSFLDLKNYGHEEKYTETEIHWVTDSGDAPERVYEPTDEQIISGDVIDVEVEIEKVRYVAGPSNYRAMWGWMSNNSVAAEVGQDLTPILDGIAHNGEPGVIYLDLSRKYGRLVDPPNNKDRRVTGYNPCAEQSLESGECCTLVETYLNRHDSLEDYQRTLKVAYLYAKTVTLLPTHWPKTNAIMQRNRRIGTSMSGIANFADRKGLTELRTWMNTGYQTVKTYDTIYSEWLCVRESIKATTVKPSGTVSILAGESPGVHWTPGGEFFERAIRFGKDDPMLLVFANAGYRIETDVANPETTVICFFPIHSLARRSERDVTLFEKANLAVLAQRYWSDNSVSVTLSFDAEKEAQHVGTVLHMHDGQLKTVSFLAMGNRVFKQAPYTQITAEQFEAAELQLLRADFSPIYDGLGREAIGESFCSTDACEVKTERLNEVAA